MKKFYLNTLLYIYGLIDSGRKTYDTRAPDFKDENKRFDLASPGDIAIVIPVDEQFRRIDRPELMFSIGEVYYFSPGEYNGDWRKIIKKMFKDIPVEKIFPRFTIEEALSEYERFSSTDRIGRNGIVAMELAERLE
ncbi:MAG: hypothetical protein Q8N99_01225 [Nanoarchaeota archaeon]|nr:hypothetical protein [Nanoarchaeota archaeon]